MTGTEGARLRQLPLRLAEDSAGNAEGRVRADARDVRHEVRLVLLPSALVEEVLHDDLRRRVARLVLVLEQLHRPVDRLPHEASGDDAPAERRSSEAPRAVEILEEEEDEEEPPPVGIVRTRWFSRRPGKMKSRSGVPRRLKEGKPKFKENENFEDELEGAGAGGAGFRAGEEGKADNGQRRSADGLPDQIRLEYHASEEG